MLKILQVFILFYYDLLKLFRYQIILENRYIIIMNSENISFSVFKPNGSIELSINCERVCFHIGLLLGFFILSVLDKEYFS